MGKLRELVDRILLSDHEWKKKYCPTLYHYLFEMTPEERYEAFMKERRELERSEHGAAKE